MKPKSKDKDWESFYQTGEVLDDKMTRNMMQDLTDLIELTLHIYGGSAGLIVQSLVQNYYFLAEIAEERGMSNLPIPTLLMDLDDPQDEENTCDKLLS